MIARAVTAAAPGMRLDAAAPVPAIEGRDLLEDLADVLGPERVKLRDAVGLLRKHAPTWPPYQRMTAVRLGTEIRAEGVKTVNASGTQYLDPAELHRVLAEREVAE